jgi:hypothetical protein
MSTKKTLGEKLGDIVTRHLLPVVVYTVVFFVALNSSLSKDEGLAKAIGMFFCFIPGLAVWMLVWMLCRTIFKTVSGPAGPPADPPELDSAERLKLSAEAEVSAQGAPIKDVVEDKPGYSVGFWMAWFWGLVGVGWVIYIVRFVRGP